MARRSMCHRIGILALGLALLHETLAYHSNAHTRYGEQGDGLSAGATRQRAYIDSGYSNRIQEQPQPIYERSEQVKPETTEYFSGCPTGFTGLLAYAYDCHRFINCFQGRATIQSCGPGTAFDPTTLQCDYADKMLCAANSLLGAHANTNRNQAAAPQRSARLLDGEPKCPQGYSGLQPHPTDCGKFLNCNAGQTNVQSCGPGTAFSMAIMVCDHLEKVDCGLRPHSELAHGHASGSASCPPGFSGVQPHPQDVHKYLICGVNVAMHEAQCQPGYVFKSSRMTCVYDATAEAVSESYSTAQSSSNLLCPNGIAGLFVHPFDHTRFLHCQTLKIAVQTCIAGQAFSISKGRCFSKSQLSPTDYVSYIVSGINFESSLMLTSCPPGTEGLHLYPYDGAKYLYCAANGTMSIRSCVADMVYSIAQKACRDRRYVNSSDRVKFASELQFQQSDTLSQCPRSMHGAYPYPFHSSIFLLCQHGSLQLRACPEGSVFSLSQRKCASRLTLLANDYVEYDHTMSLSTELMQDLTTVSCPSQALGYFLYPFDCTKYLHCQHQQTIIESCPGGQVFSILRRRCKMPELLEAYERVDYLSETLNELYEDVAGSQLDAISCPPGATGLYAHPTDCRQFLNCTNGQTFMQSCGPGTAWNHHSSTCVYINQDDCSAINDLNSGTAAAAYQLKCPANAYGLFAHPFDSRSFLRCLGELMLVQRCPVGDAFSVSRGFCLPLGQVPHSDRASVLALGDHKLETTVSCPPSATGAGTYAYPFDCTRYLSCDGSGALLLSSCPAGMHFSISRRSCQALAQVERMDRVIAPTELQILFEWWLSIRVNGDTLNIECPTGLVGFYQHPRLASKFLTCRSGQTLISDCPSGNIFSISQHICKPSQEMAMDDRCDYEVFNYVTERREPKAPQWSTTTTSTTSSGDRWSNMNMQRPAGFDYHQQHALPGSYLETKQPFRWSGVGSSHDQLAPTHHVLYEEGSLQPNRNYQKTAIHTFYQAPLAPMAPLAPHGSTTTTSKTYYAEPVDSAGQERATWPETPRQSSSRKIDNYSPTSSWQPLPREKPHWPTAEVTSGHHASAGQQPMNLDFNPLNEYGADQQPSESKQQPTDLFDGYQPVITSPSVPPNHRPNYGDSPVYDQSNLFGGLLPPTGTSAAQPTTPSRVLVPPTNPTPSSNLRTYAIYPPVANSTAPRQPSYPQYSGGYAGVAHSRNASWQKVPQTVQPARGPVKTQTQQSDPFQDDYDDRADTIGGYQPLSTTTAKHDLSEPPFIHQFYNPSETNSLTDENNKLPNSEALRMLLRPYFNHSGTANDKMADKIESHIMSVIKRPPTTPTTTSATIIERHAPTTALNKSNLLQKPDDDVELISAGEQESLGGIDDDDTVDVRDARTEQTLPSSTTVSSTTRRVDTDSHNWHAHGHSRDFHRRHPNLPDPFEKPSQIPDKHHAHGHSHHHHPFHHSVDFHRSHPWVPNPFADSREEHTRHEQPSDMEPDYLPSPNAEETTPRIDARSSFDFEPPVVMRPRCEFDCGGGKCVNQSEVCDGVNNCGNRLDEQQCDHLGYQVKLNGGESPHMGRIEVKVNGHWGYVCDDKFGLPDADVVCRELGYKMGALSVQGNSFYAPTEQNFNYVMDEVECRGNESKLKDCDFKGWGVHNCGLDEVVGVTCKVPIMKCPNDYWLCATSKECIPPAFVCDHTEDCADKSDESDAVCHAAIQYRLEGGRNRNEGRLEVKYHGQWGTVCDDDFNMRTAQVACNSLGYYGQPTIEKNIFGPGSGPIWLDQVSCFGNETTIDKCSHWNWGEHNCNHTEDVGLRCTAGAAPRQRARQLQVGPLVPVNLATGNVNRMDDIGLWERSSKAINTPRRCGIFKEDLEDEYAHPEERVVQGAVARRGRHPWQATIRTRGRGGISSHWCGAVLISKRHLLTAAHCLFGHPKGAYFVRVGDHYATIAESSEVDAQIENWYTHEKFRQESHMNNDIALVVLKAPLKFSDYVQPICLPEKGAKLTENRNCTISGWGSIKSGVSTPSQVLRAAHLPILSEEICKKPQVYGRALTEGMFCAGSLDESVDACEGDSGGPLVCSDEDGETLYGIISWGQHCGYVNKPGVYVRVGHYIDWIYEKINQSLQHA